MNSNPVLSEVVTWPAPASEAPSPDYQLTVNGTSVFVYSARVREEIDWNDGGLATHQSGCAAARCAFARFDFCGEIEIEVRPARAFQSAAILPQSLDIAARIENDVIRFSLQSPRDVTLLLDGSDEVPLHLCSNAPEENAPDPDDPNALYFGAGEHEITTLALQSNQTLYLAGGAIVRAKLSPGESGTWNENWKVRFYDGAVISIKDASHVRIAGRGILDGSLLPHPARPLICTENATDLNIEGIVLRDAPNWNMCLAQSHDVSVRDVKIISGRLNSDGINSVNSQNVRVQNCFIRNHDDSIAVKTTQAHGECRDILIEDNTIWNDWGFALGVTYETRAPISGVLFRRNHILFVRHWALGVYATDRATVSNIRFEEISVENFALVAARFGQDAKLIRIQIGQDMFATDAERGHIENIAFRGIEVRGAYPVASEIFGFDGGHQVENVRIENLKINGSKIQSLEAGSFQLNEFARNVEIIG